MIEYKGLKKILYMILKKLGIIKEKPVSKEEMCKSARESNVCNNDCDSCIWGG